MGINSAQGLGYSTQQLFTIIWERYIQHSSLGALSFGHLAPSSTDSGSSGNIIIDFYWGMELYPRIGEHFDIKVFTNCRFGMMSWAVLALTYCIKQVASHISII
ncbi:hypothetical protein Ahy_A04g021646 isoform D [Arachis hypogaea]|uniref:7-dehydrocholesterol reductase n=1 Tax=Arachis hypogaea TaxID=3818 RepID=A0A445DL46_ARAHY|nr:hypothetical protein Ahy_A04g021646 isoform D [Arachis hypogaea]